VRYRFQGQQLDDRIWAEGEVTIDPSAQLVAPLVLGPGVQIGRGARVVGPTVIGARCRIGADASIENTVLWEDNLIGEGALLRSCVIGRGNRIGAKAHISDGAIISDTCDVGPENRLERGVRVWPGATLKAKAISFS